MPPAITTGIDTFARTACNSASRPAVPRTCPPAPIPCATTKSQPASWAATASATDPTCHAISAFPEGRARSTSDASGAVQKISTTRNRSAARSKVARSSLIQWPKNPIPTLPPAARSRARRIRSSDDSRANSHNMPSAPACATVPANSGTATPPIAACCNGWEHPTRRVNAVSIGPANQPYARRARPPSNASSHRTERWRCRRRIPRS